VVRAVIRHKGPNGRWREAPLAALGSDRHAGTFPVDDVGRHRFRIEAWVDRRAGWLDEYDRKLAAGQADLSGELSEGVALFGEGEVEDWRAAAAASGTPERHGSARSDTLELEVERERARSGAWYELFPRSFGGFAGVTELVPQLAALGFDVVYFPPIHTRSGSRTARVETTPSGPSLVTWAAPGRSVVPRAVMTRSIPSSATRATCERSSPRCTSTTWSWRSISCSSAHPTTRG